MGLLLFLAAVEHQGGAEHTDAEYVAARGAAVGEFLVVDGGTDGGCVLAAVFRRPVHGQPAPVGQPAAQLHGKVPVVFLRPAPAAFPVGGQFGLDEPAQVAAKLVVVGSETVLHRGLLGVGDDCRRIRFSVAVRPLPTVGRAGWRLTARPAPCRPTAIARRGRMVKRPRRRR